MNSAAPPQNLEAEEHVLGAMLLSGAAIEAVSEAVIAADFYRESHGRIYRAMVEMYERGEPVDPLTVADDLYRQGILESTGGSVRVQELAALTPSASNAAHYARIVSEQAALRRLVRAGQEIARLAVERDGGDVPDLLDRAEQLVFDAAQRRLDRTQFARASDLLSPMLDRLGQLQDAGGATVTGLSTGLSALDGITAGLHRGHLVVVGARPSLGKTGLAHGFALQAALRSGVPAAIFSLEMSRDEVVQRLVASEGRVDLHRFRTGKLDARAWKRLVDASALINAAPIYIDDAAAPSILEVRAKARRLKMREPNLGLIVVDYLQLMTQDAENRVQEVSKISRALKALAKDLDVPVVALSQLSRQVEQRHDKRPMLSDLRESGQVEADADVVILLYRDEVYHPDETDLVGVAELNVAKQRNGPTSVVKATFSKRSASFSDLVVLPGTGNAA